MIGIINYGVGNIRAISNIYNRLSLPVKVINSVEDFENVTKLILPGVGAFDYAMSRLNDSGLRNSLENMVLQQNIPIIGICVGMQMLAKSSDEGILPGLGWIDAKVKKFDASKIPYTTRLPHMGWNNVKLMNESPILEGLDDNAKFYFLHSYFFSSYLETDIIARSFYGIEFTCAVNHNNIYGVQFHPEKSHQWGIRLLENFAKL